MIPHPENSPYNSMLVLFICCILVLFIFVTDQILRNEWFHSEDEVQS